MVQSLFFPDQLSDLFAGCCKAAGYHAFGMRVDGFSAVETDRDVGDANGCGVAGPGAYLDFAFYPRLGNKSWSATL